MVTLLAASNATIFEVVNNLFARADMLTQPRNLLPHLEELSIVWSSIFLAAGLVCMFHGYKFYKVVTVILALAIGGCMGYYLGTKVHAAYIVSGCLAALLAVCCWPLMKYAVAAMGGLAGAFLGANAWSAISATMDHGARPDPAQQTYWIGALAGLIVCGMLAFILFKLSVVLFTSVSGATIAVLGAISLLLQVPNWRQGIIDTMQDNAMVIPVLVVVPAMIGLIIQHARPEKGGGGGGKPAKAA